MSVARFILALAMAIVLCLNMLVLQHPAQASTPGHDSAAAATAHHAEHASQPREDSQTHCPPKACCAHAMACCAILCPWPAQPSLLHARRIWLWGAPLMPFAARVPRMPPRPVALA